MSLEKYLPILLIIYLNINSVNAVALHWKHAVLNYKRLGEALQSYNLTEVKCSECIGTTKAKWTSKEMFGYLQGERICRQKAVYKEFEDLNEMSKDTDDEIMKNHNDNGSYNNDYNKNNKVVMTPEEFEHYLSRCMDGYNIPPEWQKMLMDDLQMVEMFCIKEGFCKKIDGDDWPPKSQFISREYIFNLYVIHMNVHKKHQLIEGFSELNGFKSLDEVDKLDVNDLGCKKCLDSTKQRWNSSLEINQAYHFERLCKQEAISDSVYKSKAKCTPIRNIQDNIAECLDKKGVTKDDQLLMKLYGFANQFCLNKGFCKSSYVNPNQGDKKEESTGEMIEEPRNRSQAGCQSFVCPSEYYG